MEDERILLVHHYERGAYDFWVPPGGKLEGNESILQCAQRETLEETGLSVGPGRIAYIQEFVQSGYHFCKFFVLCSLSGGELGVANRDADETFLVDARFFSQEDLSGVDVRPEVIRSKFWHDLRDGFSLARYLGLEHVGAFWQCTQ